MIGTVHPLTAFEWDEEEGLLRVTDYFNPPVEVWEEPTDSEGQKGLTFFRTVSEMFALLTGAGFRVEQVVEPMPYDATDPRDDLMHPTAERTGRASGSASKGCPSPSCTRPGSPASSRRLLLAQSQPRRPRRE